MFLCSPPPQTLGPDRAASELALYTYTFWPAERRTVHVRFMDGDPALWKRVAGVITGDGGWNRICGLQFVFDQSPTAEVHVTFTRGGSWSYMGSDCAVMPQEKPTMQLGWLNVDTSEKELRRVTLHEFGHALGFLHEHQSPNVAIKWNLPVVYEYYKRVSGWDEKMTYAQVISSVAASAAQAGPFDSESIMCYGIPPEFTLDNVAHGGRGVCSAGDIEWARHWYGPPPPIKYKDIYMPIIKKQRP